MEAGFSFIKPALAFFVLLPFADASSLESRFVEVNAQKDSTAKP